MLVSVFEGERSNIVIAESFYRHSEKEKERAHGVGEKMKSNKVIFLFRDRRGREEIEVMRPETTTTTTKKTKPSKKLQRNLLH